MVTNYRVVFLPDNIEIEVPEGKNVLQAAGLAGVELDGPCGGNGSCGKCRVRILDEKGAYQWVLACRTEITRDLTVEIPQWKFLYIARRLSLAALQSA